MKTSKSRLIAIASIFIISLVIVSCDSNKPRSKFRKGMNEQFEKLHDALRNFGSGSVTVETKAFGNGGMSSGSVQMPQTTVIQNRIEQMYDYFSSINLAVYDDILLARNEKEWVEGIQSDFKKHIVQIKSELETIKANYNQSPDSYPLVKVREDGDLLFMDYFRQTGSYLGGLLNMDIVDWLNSID
jgi:hypothetical protein